MLSQPLSKSLSPPLSDVAASLTTFAAPAHIRESIFWIRSRSPLRFFVHKHPTPSLEISHPLAREISRLFSPHRSVLLVCRAPSMGTTRERGRRPNRSRTPGKDSPERAGERRCEICGLEPVVVEFDNSVGQASSRAGSSTLRSTATEDGSAVQECSRGWRGSRSSV